MAPGSRPSGLAAGRTAAALRWLRFCRRRSEDPGARGTLGARRADLKSPPGVRYRNVAPPARSSATNRSCAGIFTCGSVIAFMTASSAITPFAASRYATTA